MDRPTGSPLTLQRHYHVVVVGGGPAGTACALRLAQRMGSGQGVLLVERQAMPRDKVCGCCINGAAIDVLRGLGLAGRLEQLGAVPLRDWLWGSDGRRVSVPLPVGYCLSRAALDESMFAAAAQAGVETIEQCEARLSAPAGVDVGADDAPDGPVRVWLRRGREPWRCVRADVVVLATGLAGHPAAEPLPWRRAPAGPVGLGATFVSAAVEYTAGTIYMASAPEGYAGLVRLEDGRLDIAAAIYAPETRQGNAARGESASGDASRPGDQVARILDQAGFPPIPEIAQVSWKGTPRMRRQRVVGEGRIVAVGDAAGYIEPFTGEGIAWALRTGVLAADVIPRSPHPGAESYNVGREYRRRYGRLMTMRRIPCRAMTRALRYQATRRSLRRVLEWAPWLAHPVVRLLNLPLSLRTASRELD